MNYKDYGNTVAILGASNKPERFSNKAVKAFKEEGFKVFPVNPKEGKIEDLKCFKSLEEIKENIDIVSVYLKPEISIQKNLTQQITLKTPKLVILNPGTSSMNFNRQLQEAGLNFVMQCSIRGLGHSPEEY
ncbi:CoA-binding protein [Candidatus Woesearchaeota archaeon]|nr:CoA-binding protein [Candidatus Woesearchaeota archaeon]